LEPLIGRKKNPLLLNPLEVLAAVADCPGAGGFPCFLG
jgi:hypothetical protein